MASSPLPATLAPYSLSLSLSLTFLLVLFSLSFPPSSSSPSPFPVEPLHQQPQQLPSATTARLLSASSLASFLHHSTEAVSTHSRRLLQEIHEDVNSVGRVQELESEFGSDKPASMRRKAKNERGGVRLSKGGGRQVAKPEEEEVLEDEDAIRHPKTVRRVGDDEDDEVAIQHGQSVRRVGDEEEDEVAVEHPKKKWLRRVRG